MVPNLKGEAKLCTIIFVCLACLVSVTLTFSDGSKLARGTAATRRMYCHRPVKARRPLHFDPDCGGLCNPRLDGDSFYNITVSNSTYWLDAISVNITAKNGSGKAVTGFSVYALDEQGGVAGSFTEDDVDVIVGTCSNVIAYSDEKFAAFHRKANLERNNVSIQWQPDGFNHGPVIFAIWIVNDHSDVYYMETPPLTCRRNGSYSLDLESNLNDVIDAVDLDLFENTFKYRYKLGYNLDDPFSSFENAPMEKEIVPSWRKAKEIGWGGILKSETRNSLGNQRKSVDEYFFRDKISALNDLEASGLDGNVMNDENNTDINNDINNNTTYSDDVMNGTTAELGLSVTTMTTDSDDVMNSTTVDIGLPVTPMSADSDDILNGSKTEWDDVLAGSASGIESNMNGDNNVTESMSESSLYASLDDILAAESQGSNESVNFNSTMTMDKDRPDGLKPDLDVADWFLNMDESKNKTENNDVVSNLADNSDNNTYDNGTVLDIDSTLSTIPETTATETAVGASTTVIPSTPEIMTTFDLDSFGEMPASDKFPKDSNDTPNLADPNGVDSFLVKSLFPI